MARRNSTRGFTRRGKLDAATALVLNILGEGRGVNIPPVPIEAVELALCEMFHCRPSELQEEDGWTCMRMYNLRHWRTVAQNFREDPHGVSREDRMRLRLLMSGKEDALHMDIKPQSQTEKVAGFMKQVDKEAKDG